MAVTSNIHYNLVAWAAGTFTSGQRCSNAGNAYQCTTAGGSTGAPTGTGSAINNGGTAVFRWLSAIDYVSLQAWANALPSTLTQAYFAQLWNNGPITTTSGVAFLNLTGHATTPTNSISIGCAPGEGTYNAGGTATNPFSAPFSSTFGGGGSGAQNPLEFNSAAGVSFVLPSTGVGGINYVLIQDDNVTITGVQFQDPNPTSGSTILQPTQNLVVQNCVIDGYGQGGGATIIGSSLGGASTAVFSLLNSLVVDRSPDGSGTAVYVNYNTIVANCTIVMPTPVAGEGGVINNSVAAGVTTSVINTVIIGFNTTGAVGATGTATMNVSYSLFDVAALTGGGVVTGAGNVYGQTASSTFLAPGTDYRLKPTSAAVNAGFTDTADIPAAVDFYGTSRPQGTAWDIGADEALTVTSTFSGGGHASGAWVSQNPRSVFAGGGRASGAFVSSRAPSTTAFSGGGRASGAFVSTANQSSFSGGGQASGTFFDAQGALNASITLGNPGAQTVNVPFLASGTLTLVPNLQFADDAAITFTPIPSSGISALGSTPFSFTHPGVPTVGTQNLLVEDLSTDASAAVNYPVLGTAPPPPVLPPTGNNVTIGPTLTGLAAIIPTYLYEQYNDDDNVRAFFTAYDIIAQSYLDWFNSINLPIYTGTQIAGPLLDWVAQGLYGISRPTLSVITSSPAIGPFNTYTLNSLPFNTLTGVVSSTIFTVTDDIFRRIITWNFYKGDGFAFSVLWLKRRVARFLAGTNGTDYDGPTYQISVTFTGTSTVNITLSNGAIALTAAPILQAAILSGVLPLPFQYSFNVLINT